MLPTRSVERWGGRVHTERTFICFTAQLVAFTPHNNTHADHKLYKNVDILVTLLDVAFHCLQLYGPEMIFSVSSSKTKSIQAPNGQLIISVRHYFVKNIFFVMLVQYFAPNL